MNVMARERAIEHVGPPQETPVTAAMRYGHGLIRKNTWQNTGWTLPFTPSFQQGELVPPSLGHDLHYISILGNPMCQEHSRSP